MHMCGYILDRSVRSNHAYVRMFHANEATPGVCALPTNREWLIQRQAARAEAQQLQRRSEEAEAGRWSGGDGANVTGWARVVLQVSFGQVVGKIIWLWVGFYQVLNSLYLGNFCAVLWELLVASPCWVLPLKTTLSKAAATS